MDFIERRYLEDDIHSFLKYKSYHNCFDAQCILFENFPDSLKYLKSKLQIIGIENNQVYQIDKVEFDKWKSENDYCISMQIKDDFNRNI